MQRVPGCEVMNKDMKRIMYEMMEESIDDVVRNDGFVRRKNSLIYSKKIGAQSKKLQCILILITVQLCKYIHGILLVFPRLTIRQKK